MIRKTIIAAVLLTLGAILFQISPATRTQAAGSITCADWTQVNNNAFGMGDPSGQTPPYADEEGFEVLEFNNQLYVGMEADNIYGARLWRTIVGVTEPSSQADWEEVAANASGQPFGDSVIARNDHIDSLAEFNGYLYASTANQGSQKLGTRVFRSQTGNPYTSSPWQDAIAAYGPGFGDVNNTNFKDMQVFDGMLCGGTQNAVTGAQVWCTSDGTTWTQKNNGGFGSSTNLEIWSGFVFNGALYLGVQNTDNSARLFRTTSLSGTPTWEQVLNQASGVRVDILGDLLDYSDSIRYLYISVRSSGGILIFRSSNGNTGTWALPVNSPGMDSNPQNLGAAVDTGTIFNEALYIGITNTSTGFELWRTTGALQAGGLVDWVQIGDSGLTNPNNTYAELIPYNGLLYAWTSNYVTGQQVLRSNCQIAKYLIVLIGDGMGANQIKAADSYAGGSLQPYETWDTYWLATYPAGGSYNTGQAWSVFDYVKSGATDSAAAATALFTGNRTTNGYISVSTSHTRLTSIADKARNLGRVVGAVTTIYISHATPGAWCAHNDDRNNGYAIADECLWENPNTTGSGGYYSGGYGITQPAVNVLIGAGHPTWNGGTYVNAAIRGKLAGTTGNFTFVERVSGSPDGGTRLLNAASNTSVTKLAGLFGGTSGYLEYRLANGSGASLENPTLAQMTTAALTVLGRNPNGFVLMVEGGAIDQASHANNLNQAVGEQIGFNQAVQVVLDWVNDPSNDATWRNTLVIVTADHETGYLTAGPGLFPNQPLGTVSDTTLALEKTVTSTGYHASWVDTNNNNEINSGETVYWAWNYTSHTNSLVPLYARGAGAGLFAILNAGQDSVRGLYLDNTDVFTVMEAVLRNPPASPTSVTLDRFLVHNARGTPILLAIGLVTCSIVGFKILRKLK